MPSSGLYDSLNIIHISSRVGTVSVYSGKIALGGDLQIDDDSEYLKAIRDILIKKFPFLPDLVAEGEFSDSGVSTSMGFGMRYLVQVGYRF